MNRSFVSSGIAFGLVLQAVARPDLVDPDVVSHRRELGRSVSSMPAASSDERRVHRPLDAGDLDLDPGELLRRLGALLAHERGGVTPPPGRAMQDEQGVPTVGQGLASWDFGAVAMRASRLRFADGV